MCDDDDNEEREHVFYYSISSTATNSFHCLHTCFCSLLTFLPFPSLGSVLSSDDYDSDSDYYGTRGSPCSPVPLPLSPHKIPQ